MSVLPYRPPPVAMAVNPADLLFHSLESYTVFGSALQVLIYTALAFATPEQKPEVAALITGINYNSVFAALGAIGAGHRGPSDKALLRQITALRCGLVRVLGEVILEDALRPERALRNSMSYEARYLIAISEPPLDPRVRPTTADILRMKGGNPW